MFLEQLAADTKQYVKAVFTTLVATVPKAIIHAQVKMSQEHLLERLYAYVTGLKPMELDGLLDEETEVTQKRAAAQMSIKVRCHPSLIHPLSAPGAGCRAQDPKTPDFE